MVEASRGDGNQGDRGSEAGEERVTPLELVALAGVAAVLAALIAYEAVHFREQRARVRANPSATLAEMRG